MYVHCFSGKPRLWKLVESRNTGLAFLRNSLFLSGSLIKKKTQETKRDMPPPLVDVFFLFVENGWLFSNQKVFLKFFAKQKLVSS